MRKLPWKIVGIGAGIIAIALIIVFFVSGGFQRTGLYQRLMRTDAEQEAFEACLKTVERSDLVIAALEKNQKDFAGFERAAGKIRQEHWDDIDTWRKEKNTFIPNLPEADRLFWQDELKNRETRINTLIEGFADPALIEEHKSLKQKQESEEYQTNATEEEIRIDEEKLELLSDRLAKKNRRIQHIRHEISTL